MCIYYSTHGYEYGPISRFVHLLDPFPGRASILLCCCRTLGRNSDHCNSMINIMIVFLPHNVRARSIIKGRFPNAYTIMHEVPTFSFIKSCKAVSFISYTVLCNIMHITCPSTYHIISCTYHFISML